jgi:hypothetical protein
MQISVAFGCVALQRRVLPVQTVQPIPVVHAGVAAVHAVGIVRPCDAEQV